MFCLCGGGGRERGEVDGVCGRGAHGVVGSLEESLVVDIAEGVVGGWYKKG